MNILLKLKLLVFVFPFLLIGCGGGGESEVPPSKSSSTSPDIIDDKIYRVFTTNPNLGNMGGIAGADSKCMSDAGYPGSGTFKAFLVDGVNRIASATANAGDGQIDWVLKQNASYYLTDAVTKIFTTNSNSIYVFGSLENTLTGTDPGGPLWTGLNPDWTTNANTCLGWTDSSSANTGGIGSTGASNSDLISIEFIMPCSNSSDENLPDPMIYFVPLLCIEQ